MSAAKPVVTTLSAEGPRVLPKAVRDNRGRAPDNRIVVRFTPDEPAEPADKVEALLASAELFLPLTVRLETEWVLRSRVSPDRRRLLDALERVLELPRLRLEHADRFRRALAWARQGMDFADALHLAACEPCEASSDGRFARRAASLGATSVVVAP